MSLISSSEAKTSIESDFYDLDRVGDIFSDSASPLFFKWERQSFLNQNEGFRF